MYGSFTVRSFVENRRGNGGTHGKEPPGGGANGVIAMRKEKVTAQPARLPAGQFRTHARTHGSRAAHISVRFPSHDEVFRGGVHGAERVEYQRRGTKEADVLGVPRLNSSLSVTTIHPFLSATQAWTPCPPPSSGNPLLTILSRDMRKGGH